MAVFVPRLSAPSYDDPYWISSSAGGLNGCVKIDGNSVLPNCVGYAWGRFYEVIGRYPTGLCMGNAKTWYDNTTGFQKSATEPKLGAVCVWGTNDGTAFGHVAVVEQILENGDIVTSESAYGGDRFLSKTITRESGYVYWHTRPFLGFIYPDVDFDQTYSNFSDIQASTNNSEPAYTTSNDNPTVEGVTTSSEYVPVYSSPDGATANYNPTTVSSTATSKKLSSSNDDVYTVKKNDSLASIAKDLLGNVNKLENIKVLNGLKSNKVSVGQKLLIPKKSNYISANSTIGCVASIGCGLVKNNAKTNANNYGIATKNYQNYLSTKKLNLSNMLSGGGGSGSSSGSSSGSGSSSSDGSNTSSSVTTTNNYTEISQTIDSSDSDFFEYKVTQKNDCLWAIAEKYLGSGRRYTEIMALNNLTDTIIYIGDILKIPNNK